MSRNTVVAAALCAFAIRVASAEPLMVAQDGSGQFNGNDHQPIQAAIDQAAKQGGGEVIIAKGDYLIGTSLKIGAATNLTIRGQSGTVLRLPPLPHAQSVEAALAGATSLRVDRVEGFTMGMQLHFVAPGKVHPFTGKPAPYFLATVARVEPGRLEFKAPLEFPAPAGTRLYREKAPNIFRIQGSAANIVIERLTLNGGRRADDPKLSGHVIGCGVLAEGPYSYERGPIGPPVQRLVVRDCVIRCCYGRGVAMYSVTEGVVERCTIEETVDEAIDFDHFAVGCRAVGNTVTGCRVGVEMNDANNCLVRGNRFESCDAGINLWRWCRQPELNVRNQVLENQFLNTRGSAILIRPNSASNDISGNIVRGSGSVGIILEGSHQTLAENTVTGSAKEAIRVNGDDNIVRGNRCRDNNTAKPGQGEAIRVTGDRNRVNDNIVTPRPGTTSRKKS
ncbi:MAG: right-handed parallel beta-helix repeat-containing protein [Verrucomicrobia bacterium]|nr:right-handed parallel beta-helix repeat-containing protein [Verrucomicrobiota bacterium]